ncbi:MAG: TIR domain-containing protein [Candidatus Hodarchaeota archaeon]
MKVFISWSGPKSLEVAKALHSWLPFVINALEPWMSSDDIQKGTRWATSLAAQLEETRVGLICLTRGNLEAPWILFEAGALSKTLDHTFVCPYLVDLEPGDVEGPLAQFQSTKADKEDTRRLLHTINRALDSKALSEQRLNTIFERWWPDLEGKLSNLPEGDDSVTSQMAQYFPYEIILKFPDDFPEAARKFIEWKEEKCVLIGPNFQDNITLVPWRGGGASSFRVEMGEHTMQKLSTMQKLKPKASYKLVLTDLKNNSWRVDRFYPSEVVLTLEPLVPRDKILRDLLGDINEK